MDTETDTKATAAAPAPADDAPNQPLTVNSIIRNIEVHLTLQERDEIAWWIIRDWPGPLAIQDRPGLGLFPVAGMVKPGHTTHIDLAVNTPFKPVRLVINTAWATRHIDHPYLFAPAVETRKKRWWGLCKDIVTVSDRRIVKEAWKEPRLEEVGRAHWTVHAIYVGNEVAIRGPHPMNGESFSPFSSSDHYFPTAQRGHVISIVVSHDLPWEVPFRGVLLGKMPKERVSPIVFDDGEFREFNADAAMQSAMAGADAVYQANGVSVAEKCGVCGGVDGAHVEVHEPAPCDVDGEAADCTGCTRCAE